MSKNSCEGCTASRCYIPCPECSQSGIFIGAGINGIREPNFYGLEHPLNLLESCRLCGGEKIIYCPDYKKERFD